MNTRIDKLEENLNNQLKSFTQELLATLGKTPAQNETE